MTQPARTLTRHPARPVPVREPARRTALRVVPAVISSSGHVVFAAVCIALCVAGLVGLLMLNTAIGQGAFELQRLQLQSQQLADTAEALAQQLDTYRSPAALAARARELGMVPAQTVGFLRLSDGAILGTAEPAKAPVVPATAKPAGPTATKPTTTTATKPATKPATTTATKPATKPTATKPATTKPATKPATAKPAH